MDVREKIWSLNTSGGSEVLISRLGRVLPFQRTFTGIVVVSSFVIVTRFGDQDGDYDVRWMVMTKKFVRLLSNVLCV